MKKGLNLIIFYPLYDNFGLLLRSHNMLLDLKKTFILFGNSNLITMICTHLNIIILYCAIGPKDVKSNTKTYHLEYDSGMSLKRLKPIILITYAHTLLPKI